MKTPHAALAFLFSLLLAQPALAQQPAEPAPYDPVVQSMGFLIYHPDMNFRNKGTKAFTDGFWDDALMYFTKAANYADKASQAMIGEMYWTGSGVPQNRALGYAWMDLAAERMYPAFLAHRERYWSQLGEAERERAIEVGIPLYGQYGDAASKPRLERVLRRGQRNVTGSRVGSVGSLRIVIPGPGGQQLLVTGSEYYADKYWRPERYWEWVDEIWSAPPKGQVDVGDLERLREEADLGR